MTPNPLAALGALDIGPGAALLGATIAMGFSEPVARAGLRAEFAAWAVPGALDRVLAEGASLPQNRRWPKVVQIIAARTLPASALRQVGLARLIGASVRLKAASGQDAVAVAIAAGIEAVTATPFDSGKPQARIDAFRGAETIVVLGSNATIAQIREDAPDAAHVVGYGHRLSVAWAAANPNDDAIAGLARDLIAWDQSGCMSPQALFCEGDPEKIAPRLAAALKVLEPEFPLELPREGAAERGVATTLAEMVGTRVSARTSELLLVGHAPFRTSPGRRVLWIHAASSDALNHLKPILSTVGLLGKPELLPQLGAHTRACPAGQMQRPPLDAPHDGGANLLPLAVPR